jgi:hypothetical protein
MTNKERIHAMILLQQAIDLERNGGSQQFDEDEYKLMTDFLNEIIQIIGLD